MVFADRDEAGRRLAVRLGHLQGEPIVVLGLPRGGVPVAFQVARALGAPLDVIIVRKLGVPFQPELGMGAVGEDGVRVLNPGIVHAAGVSDNEVIACLERAAARPSLAQASTARAAGMADPPARSQDVQPDAGAVRLAGDLTVPEGAPGIVVFAHGSGSSRHSPRNRYVAGVLERGRPGHAAVRPAHRRGGTRPGQRVRHRPARRAPGPGDRMAARPAAGGRRPPSATSVPAPAPRRRCGRRPSPTGIAAVVSRGGRPDLARPRLAAVTAPTLLIVGGRDEVVLDLNRRAQAELRCENDLAVVPGATHLFEEPGTLDAAAALARDWFITHLTQ